MRSSKPLVNFTYKKTTHQSIENNHPIYAPTANINNQNYHPQQQQHYTTANTNQYQHNFVLSPTNRIQNN